MYGSVLPLNTIVPAGTLSRLLYTNSALSAGELICGFGLTAIVKLVSDEQELSDSCNWNVFTSCVVPPLIAVKESR